MGLFFSCWIHQQTISSHTELQYFNSWHVGITPIWHCPLDCPASTSPKYLDCLFCPTPHILFSNLNGSSRETSVLLLFCLVINKYVLSAFNGKRSFPYVLSNPPFSWGFRSDVHKGCMSPGMRDVDHTWCWALADLPSRLLSCTAQCPTF